MGDEKDAFYVVRKGDIIGIYKTFADCQAQAGFSPLDPSISVYKGYGLSKETEAYLVSHGLQRAGFSISACDAQEGLFGRLSVCPFQDVGESSFSPLDAPNKPVKLENYACMDTPNGKIQKHLDTGSNIFSAPSQQNCDKLQNYVKPADAVRPLGVAVEPSCSTLNAPKKPVKLENYVEPQASVSPACVATTSGTIQKHGDTGLNIFPSTYQQNCDKLQNDKNPVGLVRPSYVSAEPSLSIPNTQKRVSELKNYVEPQQLVHPARKSCTIEFDGASKGNPGQAGAGAILRAIDGSEVWLLREGVGIATNNVAEYRSVILGLRTALDKGFKHVKVRGDSMLVCNQILGKWKTKNENMANLCKDALLLKKQFLSFTIEHVPRESNSAADTQANRAIKLREGQVEVERAHV